MSEFIEIIYEDLNLFLKFFKNSGLKLLVKLISMKFLSIQRITPTLSRTVHCPFTYFVENIRCCSILKYSQPLCFFQLLDSYFHRLFLQQKCSCIKQVALAFAIIFQSNSACIFSRMVAQVKNAWSKIDKRTLETKTAGQDQKETQKVIFEYVNRRKLY